MLQPINKFKKLTGNKHVPKVAIHIKIPEASIYNEE